MNHERPNFGPFEAAFTKDGLEVPGYLELLGLNREEQRNIQTVIDRIEHAMAGWETDHWIAKLMGELNWRPHLVGAVAFLLDRTGRLDRAPIWHAIDWGSWVIPQLAVAAFFADPLFADRVRTRLDAKCPVHSIPDLPPRPDGVRSGKMAATLLALVPDVPALASSEEGWRRDPDLIALLERDASWDHSERIVAGWIARIRECFAERGVVLVPAVG